MEPCRYRQPRPPALQPEYYVPLPKSSRVADFCYFQPPSRGPIVSHASAASGVFVRIRPSRRRFLTAGVFLLTLDRCRPHAQHRWKAWPDPKRNFILGGAAKPGCQTLPRLLNGALQMPSFAAASASTALRTSAWVVESCRGLLLSASRRNSLSLPTESNTYVA